MWQAGKAGQSETVVVGEGGPDVYNVLGKRTDIFELFTSVSGRQGPVPNLCHYAMRAHRAGRGGGDAGTASRSTSYTIADDGCHRALRSRSSRKLNRWGIEERCDKSRSPVL